MSEEKHETPLRVLVADDEVLIRMNLQEMLESSGLSVVGSCSDGFSAIETCRETRPDIVLMDIKMPMLDGLSASRYILENQLSSAVILVTAYDDVKLVEQAEAYGIAGYIVKPVSQKMLLPAIKIALARSREMAGLRQEVSDVKEELASRKLIERAKGAIMLQEGLSEQEAFDYIRNVSRNCHMSMRSVAETILGEKSRS